MAFFNVPFDFSLTVLQRLVAAGAPPCDRHLALALLGLLVAQLRPQSYECASSLADLADQLGMPHADFVTAVRWLGRVGAISMLNGKRERRLAIVPPDQRPRRGQRRRFPDAEISITRLTARGPAVGKARA